jgi:hypothetical protein
MGAGDCSGSGVECLGRQSYEYTQYTPVDDGRIYRFGTALFCEEEERKASLHSQSVRKLFFQSGRPFRRCVDHEPFGTTSLADPPLSTTLLSMGRTHDATDS